MKTLALGAVLVGVSWIVASDSAERETTSSVSAVGVHAAALASAPTAMAPATLNEIVRQYCVVCHNDQLLTGNVSLQTFNVEQPAAQADVAERMIRKLRAGMMPPPGAPRPSADTLLALVQTIETAIDQAARNAPASGGERRFQRLSQAEYERVIRDMLALEIDANRWLPQDVLVGSFDNVSAAQTFSTTLLDSFLRAATDVSRLAVGNPNAVSSTVKHKNVREISQHAWDHLEGTPYGTRGGMVVTHDFPADGEYVFEILTAFGGGNQVSMEDIDVSIDGEQVALLMLENNGAASAPVQTEPIFVRAGQRQVSVAFVDYIDGPYEDRFSSPLWSAAALGSSQFGLTGLVHAEELLVTGPRNVRGVSDTESRRRVFTCRPSSASEERPCAEQIVTQLLTKAYRRPVTAEDVAPVMEFYDETSVEEGFEIGVRTALQAILSAPEFLFRLERLPEGARPGETYRLSDVDLATRLSFFLWDAAPDDELLRVAAARRLTDPTVLEQQVRRMLADPRSEALGTRFAYQWLRLQDVGKVWPEPFAFPDFSQQLADAMVRETQMLFNHLVREDRSLLELYTADYSFLNERLARHYGIDGVAGEEMRLVEYPTEDRRGILGHGSVLLLTSMSARTSPVLRGKWVMEVLMGTPPPPPPPNVPAFEASPAAAGGRRLTTRERMEAHRAAPVCNSCHRFMDPIGLALDNYDVTGKNRIRENMAPLDTRGVFYDGTPVTKPIELVNVLMKRPIPMVRTFTNNLMAYGIGRPVEYFDQPTIRGITNAAEANGYKMSTLIMGVVKSDLFQTRQLETTAN